MKKISRLLALLLALTMLPLAAFASGNVLSVDDLNSDNYAQILAAAEDANAAVGKFAVTNQADVKVRSDHYTISGVTDTLASGTVVTITSYETGILDGALNSYWYGVSYVVNGETRTGYVQTSSLDICACETAEGAGLADHLDTCPDKIYYTTVCEQTAAEIYAGWESYPEEAQAYILSYLGEADAEKLSSLNSMLNGNPPLVDSSLNGSAGDNSIALSGALPAGTTLQFAAVSAAMQDAMASVLDLSDFNDDVQTYAFDIGLQYDGADYQPEEAVRITLGGIGAAEQGENYLVKVFHFLDTAEAVEKALTDGTAEALTVTDTNAFAAELAASGLSDTIYYTELSSANGGVSVNGTSISFDVDSFSNFYIASGNSDVSKTYPLWTEVVFEFKYNENDYTEGNTKIYVQPDTTLVFYIDDAPTTASIGDWRVDPNNNALGLNTTLEQDSHTCTIYVPKNATTSTKNFTRVIVRHKNDDYYADIYVSTKKTVVTGALDQFEMYLCCLTDPENGIPGEPGVNTRTFKAYHLTEGDSVKTTNFIKTNEFLANSKQTYDGTNTVGVVDASGVGTDVKAVTQNISWDTYFKNFAQTEGVHASDGKATKSLIDKNGWDWFKARYILVPYVLKMQTANGFSWNLDCYIMKKNSYTLKYDMNLPQSLVLTHVDTPDSVVKDKRFTTDVASAKYGDTTIAINTLINLQDNAGNNYRYVFLGWDTQANGKGTRYLPGDDITVPPNGWTGSGDYTEILYAQWARVGDLKITKTVKTEYSGDSIPNTAFTFKITIPAAGGKYDYTVYNSAGTSQSTGTISSSKNTVQLKHGQYVIIKNLPVGNVKVEEINLTSDYTSDWTGAKTAAIAADKTTTLNCVNTYTRHKGNLLIKKIADGASDASNPSFTFNVTLPSTLSSVKFKIDTGAEKTLSLTNGVGKIQLKAGQTATILDIPIGSAYSVTENSMTGYTSSASGNSGTIIAGDTTATFTNTYAAGSLKISKTVVGKGATFKFTVKLEGARVNPSYSINGGESKTLTLTNGSGTIELSNGQTATITGLPVGTKYTVTEETNGDYTTTVNGKTGLAANGTIGATESTVDFVNTHKTNSLTIKKRFSGCSPESDEAHSFTVKDSSGNVVVEVVIKGSGEVTINDLPLGAYTVTENATGAWRYAISSDRTDGKVEVKADAEGQITFTNTLNEEQWLDGNAYAENNFESAGVKRTD